MDSSRIVEMDDLGAYLPANLAEEEEEDDGGDGVDGADTAFDGDVSSSSSLEIVAAENRVAGEEGGVDPNGGV